MMEKISTSDMKTAYRKAKEGYLNAADPMRKEIYLRMSFALKVDLASRIRFKSATPSLWKRIVRTIEIVKKLNEPYLAHGGNITMNKTGPPTRPLLKLLRNPYDRNY